MMKFNSDDARDRAVAADLTARAEASAITPSICRELAKQYDLSPRSIMARAACLDLPIRLSDASERDEDNDGDHDDDDDQPTFTPDPAGTVWRPDTQYGVLQGPANFLGGCASLWGWAIVIFLAALVLALVTGQLN